MRLIRRRGISWDLKSVGYGVGLNDVKAQSFVFPHPGGEPYRFGPELGGVLGEPHRELPEYSLSKSLSHSVGASSDFRSPTTYVALCSINNNTTAHDEFGQSTSRSTMAFI